MPPDLASPIRRGFLQRSGGPLVRRLAACLALAVWLVLAAGCVSGPAFSGQGTAGVPLAVSSEAVALNPEDPNRQKLGPLVYLGGLSLSAADPRFGGLSGLLLSPDGSEMLAVSDRGSWFSAKIKYDSQGRLAGLAEARLGRLKDPAGLALKGKRRSDAEELARWRGGVLVSFERDHRLWLYPGPWSLQGVPRTFKLPPWLTGVPPNSGVEAVAPLPGGRLLLLAEGKQGAAHTLGAVGDGHHWQPLRYRLTGGFRPTSAAVLPGGDLLILERSYSLAAGAAARLVRLPAGQISPGAMLRPQTLAILAQPLSVDNMEGLAVGAGPKGELLIYLLSDDNFSAVQRTLFMMFRLGGGP